MISYLASLPNDVAGDSLKERTGTFIFELCLVFIEFGIMIFMMQLSRRFIRWLMRRNPEQNRYVNVFLKGVDFTLKILILLLIAGAVITAIFAAKDAFRM